MDPSPSVNSSNPVLSQMRGDSTPEAAVREELEKILSSNAFREAEGLKRFLRFAVEHTLNGEGDQLKEYRLGLDVFDRDSSFDPRLDPVVRMAARRLRVKLREYYESEGRQDAIRIEVPKGGYAATSAENPPQELPIASAPPGAQVPRPAARSRTVVAGLVLAALCVIALALIALEIGRKRAQPSGVAFRQIHSVAVLPLKNLSGDPSQEYLADGLTEALVADLAQVRSLRVISRTSVMTYKETKKKLPEIAHELNVDAVVEGSLIRSGNRLQVTAQLIEAPTDTHLWAQTYEGNVRDLLTLQNRVAQEIVQQVRVALTPEEKLRLTTIHPVSPEAHETYLLGRYFWNKRTPEAELKSIELFESAVRTDPNSAEAYAAMSSAYLTLMDTQQFPPREMQAKARAAAEKALVLDEGVAEPHADLGLLNAVQQYDWKASDAEFARAMELDPSYATARRWHGFMLASRGRSDEAYQEILKARDLDPANPSDAGGTVMLDYWARKYESCAEAARKAIAIGANTLLSHVGLGRCYEQMKRYDDAIGEFNQALRLAPHHPGVLGPLGHTLALVGRRNEALSVLRELENSPQSKYKSSWQEALIYVGLGDSKRAIEMLARDQEQGGIGALMLRSDPRFDPLRSEPKFLALLKKANLD